MIDSDASSCASASSVAAVATPRASQRLEPSSSRQGLCGHPDATSCASASSSAVVSVGAVGAVRGNDAIKGEGARELYADGPTAWASCTAGGASSITSRRYRPKGRAVVGVGVVSRVVPSGTHASVISSISGHIRAV